MTKNRTCPKRIYRLQQNLLVEWRNGWWQKASQKRNPLKKVGTANELAQSITFLLTEKSSWITGQILAVDGGMGALKI